MKRFQDEFLGSFNGHKVKIEVSVNKDSERLVIFCHGAYSSVYHNKKTKYQYLFEKLSKNYSVAFYQTSRLFEWQEKLDLTFEEYRNNSFKNKTFIQEFEEVQSAVEKIIMFVKDNTDSKDLEITLVGFSLGGIMSILLSHILKKEVKNIFTFGTAINFELDSKLPVINGMPLEQELQKKLNDFKGAIYVVSASEDVLSNFDKTLKLFKYASNSCVREIIQFKGIDHRFTMINGQQKESEINHMIYNFIKNNIDLPIKHYARKISNYN